MVVAFQIGKWKLSNAESDAGLDSEPGSAKLPG